MLHFFYFLVVLTPSCLKAKEKLIIGLSQRGENLIQIIPYIMNSGSLNLMETIKRIQVKKCHRMNVCLSLKFLG